MVSRPLGRQFKSMVSMTAKAWAIITKVWTKLAEMVMTLPLPVALNSK
jgi:hypothetical protein